VDTALDCHVAAVVRTVKARGATICSIEDHAHWSVGRAHDRAEDEGGTNAGKAKMRHDYFRWHQGALRSKLESVLAREGIEVRIVDPAMTSRTCPDCGKVWAETGVYAPKGVAPGSFGRISLEQFVCECGCSKQADFCAGITIARRWEAGLTPAEVDAANKAHVSTATARAAKAAKLSIQEWKTANPKKNNRKGSTSKNTSDTLNV
jgi:transposase